MRRSRLSRGWEITAFAARCATSPAIPPSTARNSARGIDARRVRQPADLGDFFTVPDDIIRDPEKFLCRPPGIVFESSGTSGRNKQVYFDRRELDYLGKICATGLRLLGVGPNDRAANAFDFSMWIPGILFYEGLKHAGIFCQSFGKVDPLEVYRRLKQYRINVVFGEPTWLIRLTELAEQHGAAPLKLLVGGAEAMPAAAIPWMREVWGGAQVKMCYGAVEMGGAIGLQPCEQHDGYHLDDVNFLTEVVGAGADGYGEVVFTTLTREVMPLVRYRTQDVSRLEAGVCACGIAAPRLSLLRGRRDEIVVASGGNLYPLMFEKILREVPGVGRDWQVVVGLENIREVLEIRVETERTDAEALREEVLAHARHLFPDLMKNAALGTFQIRVTLCRPGALRGGRKLRRLIDARHSAGNQDRSVGVDCGDAKVLRIAP